MPWISPSFIEGSIGLLFLFLFRYLNQKARKHNKTATATDATAIPAIAAPLRLLRPPLSVVGALELVALKFDFVNISCKSALDHAG